MNKMTDERATEHVETLYDKILRERDEYTNEYGIPDGGLTVFVSPKDYVALIDGIHFARSGITLPGATVNVEIDDWIGDGRVVVSPSAIVDTPVGACWRSEGRLPQSHAEQVAGMLSSVEYGNGLEKKYSLSVPVKCSQIEREILPKDEWSVVHPDYDLDDIGTLRDKIAGIQPGETQTHSYPQGEYTHREVNVTWRWSRSPSATVQPGAEVGAVMGRRKIADEICALFGTVKLPYSISKFVTVPVDDGETEVAESPNPAGEVFDSERKELSVRVGTETLIVEKVWVGPGPGAESVSFG